MNQAVNMTRLGETSKFFDAFVQIGPRRLKHPAHSWRLEDVLAEMEYCSISGALVASTMSVEYDLMHANRELSESLQGHRNLFAIWNVMPHHTRECLEPESLLRMLREAQVPAVTIHPRSNGWDALGHHAEELFEALGKAGVPVMVPATEFSSWQECATFLERYPALQVILLGVRWGEQRYLLPLLEQHRNLHFTLESYQANYGIEELVEEGLEERLIFASHAPMMAIGAARAYVDYAEVPMSVRRKIAGGNLFRLLQGLGPSGEVDNGDEDELMAAARRGLPLPLPVVDMHMHILEEGMNGGGGISRMFRGGPRDTFHLLKRLGCEAGGFMSWNGTVGADSAGGNPCVARALDVSTGAFWGLATVDPVHYSQEELAVMIPEIYADRRFIGMKPYVTYGVEYDDPAYDIWWRYGNERSFYAGIHRVRDDFREVENLARKYPNVRWVIYHCGSNFQVADGAIACMKEFSNVYAELTLTSVTSGVVEYLVEHAGADRILYGSDLPMRDPRPQLGWVVFSRLPVSVKRQILSSNARRVIAPCLQYLPAEVRSRFSRWEEQ